MTILSRFGVVNRPLYSPEFYVKSVPCDRVKNWCTQKCYESTASSKCLCSSEVSTEACLWTCICNNEKLQTITSYRIAWSGWLVRFQYVWWRISNTFHSAWFGNSL